MIEPIYTISSKRMFDKCPAQYEYRYIRELDSTKLSEALGRGITFHEQAEDAHTLGKVDVDVAKGYALWVRKHEDLTPIHTEFPIEVPLQSLYDSMHPDTKVRIRGKFAGVSDLLAAQRDDTNWLVDHKSTIRFYGFPYLYSTEQLYMYYAAYEASKVNGDANLTGVCLSRVKVEEDVPYAKARNYMVLYLKRVLGKEVTATFLAGLTKSARRAIISTTSKDVQTSTSRLPNKHTSRRPNVSTSTTKSKVFTPEPSPKRITVELNTKKQRPGTLKSIVIRNEKGYITSSIMYSNGTLVHVERSYYIPTPAELQGVCNDFLTYVDDLALTEGLAFRRSPNLHCASCPFQGPCEEERRRPLEAPRMTQVEICTKYPTLTPTPPNQEVLRAKKKASSLKSPPILQEIS